MLDAVDYRKEVLIISIFKDSLYISCYIECAFQMCLTPEKKNDAVNLVIKNLLICFVSGNFVRLLFSRV